MSQQLQMMTGDCESCTRSKNVQLTKRYNNIWMCELCWNDDESVRTEKREADIKRGKPVLPEAWRNLTIQHSQRIDSAINLKEDVFNAQTVPFAELKKAVDTDDSVPHEEKQFAYAQVISQRISEFNKAIFDKRNELSTLQSERQSYQTHLSQVIGFLRKEEREKLQIQDITYQPKPVKSPKPPSEKTGKKSDVNIIRELAKKYDIKPAAIQTIALVKKLSPEEACKELLKMMGRTA